MDAICELGLTQRRADITGIGDLERIDDRDGGLDRMRFVDDVQSDALFRLRLYVAARIVFRFDDDWRSIVRGDEYVRLPTWLTNEYTRCLPTHLRSWHHALQHQAKLDVHARFGMPWHLSTLLKVKFGPDEINQDV